MNQSLEKFDYDNLNYRIDGRVEWICPCGVGHTVAVPEEFKNVKAWWVHGCCSKQCCKGMREKYEKWRNRIGGNTSTGHE